MCQVSLQHNGSDSFRFYPLWDRLWPDSVCCGWSNPFLLMCWYASVINVCERVIWPVLFSGFRENSVATDSYCGGWMRFVALSVSPLRKNAMASQNIYIDPYYWTALYPKEIPHASSVWRLCTHAHILCWRYRVNSMPVCHCFSWFVFSHLESKRLK